MIMVLTIYLGEVVNKQIDATSVATVARVSEKSTLRSRRRSTRLNAEDGIASEVKGAISPGLEDGIAPDAKNENIHDTSTACMFEPRSANPESSSCGKCGTAFKSSEHLWKYRRTKGIVELLH
ncbi:hypothetical protein OCU04_009031 [Sclerotinia nivalis]|uniref:C2H2-type domain-containing protein n=1 Tax=Sclerotinia nivalis TaxID=352851 RepID=A0A9X0AGU1_9HELO|nr:hypothetical protein OCU04_009031 [Sclerotinia nivalis]